MLGEQKKAFSPGKGLGWISDNPDQRDYTLQRDSQASEFNRRLGKEETTSTIETLTEQILAVLESIPSANKGDAAKAIDIFRKKALGDVEFATIKVYQQIRLDSMNEKDIGHNQSLLNLKVFLYLLVQNNKIDEPNFKNMEFDKILKWLRCNDKEDCQNTEILVRAFQRHTNIVDDGFIGFETYTKLTEFENNPTVKLRQPKEPEKTTYGIEYPIDYQPVARLIPVPGFLSNSEFFEKLIKILISRAANEDNPDQNKNLTQAYGDIWNDHKYQGYTAINILEKVVAELDSLLGARSRGEREPIIEIPEDLDLSFSSFVVIEPLLSVVLSRLSPLAQYKEAELSKLVQMVFDQFEQSLDKHQLSKLESQAIRYVDKLLRDEIRFLICSNKETLPSKEEEDKLKDKFWFLILIAQFVQYCMLKDKGFDVETDTNEDSIFDKKEVFEIILPKKNPTSKKSNQKPDSKSTFFQAPSLQIPILGSFIQTYVAEQEQEHKPLFLFLPSVVDLSFWCSEVKDQGQMNSCTAFAAIGLLEYFTKRSQGKYIEVSPLFLYKVTRNLMDLQIDSGASLRETIKAMATFGVPPENYYPYNEQKVNDEPPQFCYALAERYQALKYFRLDYPGLAREMLVFQIKAVLAAGFPCAFGLTLYESSTKYESNGKTETATAGYIPSPLEDEQVIGGHAMVVVGYDDYKQIDLSPSRGAFLVRNSKGTNWGNAGYGWLPYDYVIQGHTSDWWSLLKAEWLAASTLGLGTHSFGGPKKQKGP
jgi:C1A family cysteine protease